MDVNDTGTSRRRARIVQRRRELDLEVVSGFAEISQPFLLILQRGWREFIWRAPIEKLANALSCSVNDLPGQRYLHQDGASAEAQRTIMQIRRMTSSGLPWGRCLASRGSWDGCRPQRSSRTRAL